MYNLNDVKETTGKGKSYIKPGVWEVQIVGFNLTQANNGNDVIETTFIDPKTKAEHLERFPASSEVTAGKERSPLQMSLAKIKHIAKRIVPEDVIQLLQGETLEELVESFNTNLVGITYRQKFSGEQKQGQNGMYDIARIPFPSDNYPMAEGLEVPFTQTALSFDKENPYDYKKMEVPFGAPKVSLPKMPGGNF